MITGKRLSWRLSLEKMQEAIEVIDTARKALFMAAGSINPRGINILIVEQVRAAEEKCNLFLLENTPDFPKGKR